MRNQSLNLLLCLLLGATVFCAAGRAGQGETGTHGRASEAAPAKPPNVNKSSKGKPPAAARRTDATRTPNSGGGKRNEARREKVREPEPILVPLKVLVTPPDSIVLVNGQRLEVRDQDGNWTRNFKPGTYTLAASSPGYSDETRSFTLEPGRPEHLRLALRPVPGGLSIKPATADARIEIVNKENNHSIGSYTGGVDKLSVEPGVYEVTISKRGYRTLTREVAVRPGESVYLEPPLEREAPSPPSRSRPGFAPDRATRVETARDGKYILVTLSGRSGDASAAVGTLEVLVSPLAQFVEGGSAQGMLTGFPCQVDFVRIENVADFSFSETPMAGNQWRRAVVRVRPKDAKRPVRFSINWKALRSGAEGGE